MPRPPFVPTAIPIPDHLGHIGAYLVPVEPVRDDKRAVIQVGQQQYVLAHVLAVAEAP